jgi:hypothetical protein
MPALHDVPCRETNAGRLEPDRPPAERQHDDADASARATPRHDRSLKFAMTAASRRTPANPDHWLEEARALARRTSPGLEQLVFAEHEVTGLAPGGDDLDVVTRRAGGAKGVAKVVFDVAARHAELACK